MLLIKLFLLLIFSTLPIIFYKIDNLKISKLSLVIYWSLCGVGINSFTTFEYLLFLTFCFCAYTDLLQESIYAIITAVVFIISLIWMVIECTGIGADFAVWSISLMLFGHVLKLIGSGDIDLMLILCCYFVGKGYPLTFCMAVTFIVASAVFLIRGLLYSCVKRKLYFSGPYAPGLFVAFIIHTIIFI